VFRKVLIANRGEIACRIMRTAERLGVATVAVYSDADAAAPHVAMATDAVRLGSAAVAESYLLADKVLAAAKATGAYAIHPGYGFLSENAKFAKAVRDAGLIFIGPPTDAIHAMGAKDNAKAIMEKAGVPVVPGYYGEDQSDENLAASAAEIGYPVLLKAAMGGGGKGMRVVTRPEDLAEAAASARREGQSSFGDGRLLVEKYLVKPRHVEVQVFADSHGNAVHLFERDCSLQRRHQKVIEEAPAPGMGDELRARMGAAAVAAARAVGYENAGTVEFLLAADDSFYFMEMNTRLQVEHPVTEMITGLDLVEWQFRVASGEPLPCGQDALAINGHAFEARIYAEDPDAGFLPAPGRIRHLAFPPASANVRIDTGVAAGGEVSSFYDPMIAKLIVWDADREAARRRMADALDAVEVVGPTVNRAFLKFLVEHPDFAKGDVDTGLIDRLNPADFADDAKPDTDALAVAALAVVYERTRAALDTAARRGDRFSPWALTSCWRVNDVAHQDLNFHWADGEAVVAVTPKGDGHDLRIAADGNEATIHMRGEAESDGSVSAVLDGTKRRARVVMTGNDIAVFMGARASRFNLADPALLAGAEDAEAPVFAAPMPGKVVAVNVKAGAEVTAGTTLIVLEAMKMEHAIKAPVDGRVTAVHYGVGDQVDEGRDLIAFEALEQEA
jgi:3-methylcrotonyl-CoA carboxylase alpha subunit